ncbi:TetR/AcrR family transcriptional regulator [Primorskyibacter flagellatus]|uniref:Transcriptional regulator, TetR family n=1 Tax=Primorskyibacter flagellatus TaxID=1387277 RepID=A0A1W2DW40_9RHOB|nr:TetR/AcrR family transcriptional regulator [Primorskyibacter flagellatus]SMD01537.1 transcriptional regulator, TetR family [Primorskyibacter flagellatus]
MTNAMAEDRRSWTQNPEGVRRDILAAAVSEFAERGLSGAKVDDIAARTRTSKRMIYYYFGDKMGLYTQALEAAYHKVREGEALLDLGHLPPLDALTKLVAFTFDHHRSNPDFIRMVMIENIHQAKALSASEKIRDLNIAAIEKLREICDRGEQEGIFRRGLDPVALHWQISAASFFNVSNRPTFAVLFGDEMFSDAGQAHLRSQTVEAILAIAKKHEAP